MRKAIIVLAGIVVLGAAGAGAYWYTGQPASTPVSVEATATSTAVKETTPVSKKELQSTEPVGPLQKIDDHFSKDRSYVYYETFTQDIHGAQTSSWVRVIGADPITFTRLAGPFDPYVLSRKGNSSTLTYYADANRVYLFTYTSGMGGDYSWVETLSVDRATFKALSPTFARDKNAIYETLDGREENYTLSRVSMADIATFTVLPRFINGAFAKDTNHVFYGAQILQSADPNTLVDVDEYFVKDANHVYIDLSNEVDGAYPASFVSIGQGYGEDAHAIYYFDSKVEGADRATFTLIPLGNINVGWGIDAKDKNHTYLAGEVYSQ